MINLDSNLNLKNLKYIDSKINKNLKEEEKIVLLNHDEIIPFVLDKLKLLDLIKESIPLIRNYFPNTKLYLKLETDYEDPTWKRIYLYILVNKKTTPNYYSFYTNLKKELTDLKINYESIEEYYFLGVIFNEKTLIP